MDGGRGLQETNDRSMANMQRGGTYSSLAFLLEISPNQLLVSWVKSRRVFDTPRLLVPVSNVVRGLKMNNRQVVAIQD
jgi:hypothetical protein